MIGSVWLDVADASEWLREQPLADLIITEPPHQVDPAVYFEDPVFFAEWVRAACDRLKPHGSLFAAVGPYAPELRAYLDYHPTRILCWPFPDYIPEPNTDWAHGHHVVLQYVDVNVEFPVARESTVLDGDWAEYVVPEIMRRTCGPGATILDPFVGGGKHLFAAQSLGFPVDFGGCDIRPEAIEQCEMLL